EHPARRHRRRGGNELMATASAIPNPTRVAAARRWLRLAGPFLGLALVLGLFMALRGPRFLSPVNVRIVLAQTVIVGLGAIGMTVIIISGGIDLSVGATVALSSVITALALRNGMSPATALLLGIITGGIVGAVNGLAITRLRVV